MKCSLEVALSLGNHLEEDCALPSPVSSYQLLEADFKSFNAIPWDPSTLHPPTETAFPCPKESGTIKAFSALLCTGLVVLSAQVVWASRQAKGTHSVGNVPSAFDLLGIVSTGVQFFTIVGQVGSIYIVYIDIDIYINIVYI
jgi:hypothetical protein